MSVKTLERKLNRHAHILRDNVVGGDKSWLARAEEVYVRILNEERAARDLRPVTKGSLTSREGDITKTSHNGVQETFEQVTMYFAAEKSAGIEGLNLCPFATPLCVEHCLGHTSGRMPMPNVQAAQVARTRFAWEFPLLFQTKLYYEVKSHAERIHKAGKKMVLRLNGTSDYPWEKSPVLMDVLRDAGVDEFQDYTKWDKLRRDTPDDYYLAQSVTERDDPWDVRPLSVAIVDVKPGDKMPDMWAGMPVIDGDMEHGDLRIMDGKVNDKAVVLLRAKGSLKGIKGRMDGFVKPARV